MKIVITIFILLLYFAINLTFAQTETRIKRSELPDQINTELKAKYVKYIVNEIIKKENQTKETIFEVEVQKKNTVYTLVYNNKGELIDKTKSKSFTFEGTEKSKKIYDSHDGHDHVH